MYGARGESAGGLIIISFSSSINGVHLDYFNYGSSLQLPQIKLLCKPPKDMELMKNGIRLPGI